MPYPPVLLDFESQSRADLKRVGGRRYWEHLSSRPLCCAWYDTASGEIGQWHPGDGWPHRGRTLAAHNMTFFDRFGCIQQGWLSADDHSWIDTSELARTQGLPGALAAMAQRWLGVGKDTAGSKLTVSLSTVRRPSGKNNPDAISPEEWRQYSAAEKRELGVLPVPTAAQLARVDVYNLDDVSIMAQCWPLLDDWAELEPDVVAVDRAINDRGIVFDSELAEALLECDARNTDAAMRSIAAEIGWRPAELRNAANSDQLFPQFTGLPNAQAQTVEEALAEPASWHNDLTGPFCRARQAIASIERGKLRAGLDRVSDDGRLRDMLRYYGAHTGRWSGLGMQLHNLPKPAKDYEDWTDDHICMLADLVKARKHYATQAEITLLVRACLTCGPGQMLAVSDFKGVEARANAWVAGDEQALEVFRSDRDPYKVAAAAIFGVPYDSVTKEQRDIGKRAELGCGYGAGGDALRRMVRKEAGFNIDDVVDADDVVAAWRKLHQPIAKIWYALNDAFIAVATGDAEAQVGPFTFRPSDDGKDVAIFLPTGRPIVYNEVHVKSVVRQGRWGPYKAVECSYLGRYTREHVYGGMLCENVIQALCRDLLARALVTAERDGLGPVLSVHDEGVMQVPAAYAGEAFDHWQRIMCDLPDWAEGFPIGAAGFVGRRYRK